MSEMLPYPDGCAGCGGACCKDDGCKHLMADGRCKLEVVGAHSAKPRPCQTARVGSPECVAYRVKFGVHNT